MPTSRKKELHREMAPKRVACFSMTYTSASMLGFALVVVAVRHAMHRREEPPPRFDFGGKVSVVAIRASNGRFLEVSREDGMLRATASSADSASARFRVHVLSAATVDGLRLAASAVAPWSEGAGGMVSASQCRCTGSSNEHGFGRFCHPWETADQSPWCYVAETCEGASRGSFGRRHDVCTMLNRFDDAPLYNATALDAAGAPDGVLNAGATTPAADEANARWVAPRGCGCSGYKSTIGFGSYCKGWEYEGQTPWCYVFDNCSLASASGRPGSFGHRYLDCERDGGAGSVRRRRLQEQLGRLPMTAGDEAAARKAAARAAYAARAVASTISATPAEMPRSFPRRDPDEDALLERVERLKQPHVALVSLATEGFVTVELPPHRLSLRPHARTDALSLKGVFSFLPSGAILSLATNALFNLCAPLQSSDPESASSATDTRPQVCTSYDESGSAHPKLLRVSTPKTSRFKVEAQLREPRAKPSLKPSTSRGGKAKGRGSASG